jgi:branched-chain amino acid transport system substrate-binding protein
MLTRILAQSPDCIDTGLSAPDTAVLLVKQARELGFKGVIFAAQGVPPKLLFEVAGPEYSEGLVATFVGDIDYTPAMALARDTYYKMFGKEAWLDYGLIFTDPLFVITQAMEEAQSVDPKVIAEHMPKMKVKHTIWDPIPRFWTGAKYYGVNHILINPAPMTQVENGKFVFREFAPQPAGILE